MHDQRPLHGLPDPAEVAQRIKALFGSPEQLWDYLKDRLKAFTQVWERDSRAIGEVLHAHIVVEHFLGQYLRQAHPTVDFDEWRLTYDGKVRLIPKLDTRLKAYVPGLKALGRIRNKLAHELHFNIAPADVQPMVEVAEYKAERTSAMTQAPMNFATATPEVVALDFAKWIASTLEMMSHPDKEKMELIFDVSRNIDGSLAPRRESDGTPGSIKVKLPPIGSM
jgi:hypothetical protein